MPKDFHAIALQSIFVEVLKQHEFDGWQAKSQQESRARKNKFKKKVVKTGRSHSQPDVPYVPWKNRKNRSKANKKYIKTKQTRGCCVNSAINNAQVRNNTHFKFLPQKYLIHNSNLSVKPPKSKKKTTPKKHGPSHALKNHARAPPFKCIAIQPASSVFHHNPSVSKAKLQYVWRLVATDYWCAAAKKQLNFTHSTTIVFFFLSTHHAQ